MQEIRCIKCNKLLFKYDDKVYKIDIKCPRCGTMNTIKYIEESVENGKKSNNIMQNI